MIAALLAELTAVGGRVTLRGDRLVIAVPPATARPGLIARLRAAKPALVAYLSGFCAHCGEPEWPSALLPIGTADDGHTWVHDGCYPAWLADRRSGGRRAA